MRRAVFLLLLAVGSCLAAEVPVSTAQELLSALSFAASPEGAADTTVQLQVDIALNQEAAASFDLPFVIPSNHTLTLEGAGAGMKVINFGLIVGLLFFQPDSTLVISHLNVTGHADPQLTSWPEDVGMSPTSIQRMPMWPTVWAEPGFTMHFNNSHLSAFPTDLCTPENFGTRLTTLQQLATAAGAPYDVTSAPSSTFANFNDLESPAAVLDSETQSTIGEVSLTWKNSTLSCSKPDGTWGAALSSDSSSSGGTPAWVWAVVGTVAALAAAAVAGGLLWRRRRKRIKQQQEQKLEVLDMEGGQSSDKLSGQASLASAKLSSMGKAQSLQPELSLTGSGDRKLCLATGGSSMMDQLTSSRSGVPEGAWKSRVGFIEGLQLGNLIGRGGYARVYNGRWKGTTVAVKVVETHVGPQQRYDLRDEPLLTLSLSHPNVLQGYKMCAVKVLTDGETERVTQEQCAAELTSSSAGNSNGSQGPSLSNSGGRLVPHLTNPNCMVQVMPADGVLEPGMYEMWLLSELADKGTLSDAMKAGWLSQAAPPGRNMPVILLCLLDVARGLEYLHSCSIVHGDLKPQNVLLKTSGSDRRGYVCKLGDFGLSRMLGEAQTHVDTGSYGTVTHAAPELLSEGRLTKASDVFAFGMLLWELVTGERLFADMHHMQIIVQVTQHGYRPPLPADFPPQLAILVQRCWSTDASLRPDAESVVQELITFNSTLIIPSPSNATTADGRSVGNLQGLVPAAAANSSLNVAPLGSTAISPFAAAAARHP